MFTLGLMDKTELIKQLQGIVGQGGQIAFEHGFELPTITLDCGKTAKVTIIGDDRLWGYMEQNGLKYPIVKQFNECSIDCLNGLINSINDYIKFVRETV